MKLEPGQMFPVNDPNDNEIGPKYCTDCTLGNHEDCYDLLCACNCNNHNEEPEMGNKSWPYYNQSGMTSKQPAPPKQLAETMYIKVVPNSILAMSEGSGFRATATIKDLREWTDDPILVGEYKLVRMVKIQNMTTVEDA